MKPIVSSMYLTLVIFNIINSQVIQIQQIELTAETLRYYTNLNMTSLTLAPKNHKGDSFLKLINSPVNHIKLSILAETGTFLIDNGRVSLLQIREGEFFIYATSVFQNLIFNGELVYRSVLQWKLVHHQTFNTQPTGWSDNSISICGAIKMLGGFSLFSKGEVKKQFEELPVHSAIKITANYHCIDSWSGESGFMRVNVGKNGNMEYVWTQQYDSSKSSMGIDVCGGEYPEGKLTTHIDVVFPHDAEDIIIGFGSTLEKDAFEGSFGISNVQIFIR